MTPATHPWLPRVAGIVTATLLAGATVASATPSLAATAISRVDAHTSATTVYIRSSETVFGTVRPRTKGVRVLLERSVAGHWRVIARRSTGTAGKYAFRLVTPGHRATWVLRVVTGDKASQTLHVRTVAVRFAVTAAASSIPSQTAIRLHGTVAPAVAGSVAVQELRGGAWRPVASSRLVHSRYALALLLPAGRHALRVVTPATTTRARGVSRAVIVVVGAAPPALPATPHLTVTSAEDVALGLPQSRLVFSTAPNLPAAPNQAVTFTNESQAAVSVSGLTIAGPDASSFSLTAGQATSFTLRPGDSVAVSVSFRPTAPTNCPTTANPYPVSGVTRTASLTFTSTDPTVPVGAEALAGINACGSGGASEPTWDQVAQVLGYTDTVVPPGASDVQRRDLGRTLLAGTDEVAAPYFQAADPRQPVTLTPLAHYDSPEVVAAGYQATGWYQRGAAMTAQDTCSAACHTLWRFPSDPSTTSFNQNEMLMPGYTGTSAFTPGAVFGLFTGDGSDVNYSDDSMNIAHNPDGSDLSPRQTLHNLRIYPAYGSGHIAIPDTYLVAVDITRVPSNKNYDYQDVVMVLHNAVPAT